MKVAPAAIQHACGPSIEQDLDTSEALIRQLSSDLNIWISTLNKWVQQHPLPAGYRSFYASFETFFKTIKAELIWRHPWGTRRHAAMAIFE